MTLRELLEQANEMVQFGGEAVLDLEVYSEYDYGDHCHTRALVEPQVLQITKVTDSAYSASGIRIHDEEEDEDTPHHENLVISIGDVVYD